MGLPGYLFLFQNWNISANISLRVFAADRVISSARLGATLPFDVQVTLPARFRVIDGVISSAQLGATLPFDVRVTLPARFRVNLYIALLVIKFATPVWVNDRVVSPVQVQAMLPAHFVVNLHTTLQWVNDKGYFNNVQLDDHAVQRFFSYQHTIMHSMDDYSLLPKKYYVSVSRNPTEQYDVTNHPYFIFHPNQSEFSSFSETFKGYAYHLLQY